VCSHIAECDKCHTRVEETKLLVSKVSSLPRLALPHALQCNWEQLVAKKTNPLANAWHWSSSGLWTAAALAAVAVLLLLAQQFFLHRSNLSVATNPVTHPSANQTTNIGNQVVASLDNKESTAPGKQIGEQEGSKEHSAGAYEDLLAVYPTESSSFSEEVGISTNEDGLYALKL
jgi:hypothetical protein